MQYLRVFLVKENVVTELIGKETYSQIVLNVSHSLWQVFLCKKKKKEEEAGGHVRFGVAMEKWIQYYTHTTDEFSAKKKEERNLINL